jgi:diguanylate cyclase (GGDEF)-like protein/PAS domain S-box-containing protein
MPLESKQIHGRHGMNAEEISRSHVDRYNLAARGADNGLWDWDLTTSRIHFSPRWIALLGYSELELGNTSEEWFRRIHPADLEPVQREINAHLEKGSPEFEIQHRMLHQDGCYRWVCCRGVITRDNAGHAVRITGFHSDITAEKVVDTLTGLPNRLLLLDRLTRSIEQAKKLKDFLFAVLILDLGMFDSSIHNPGSADGGSLIIAAARRLETCLRVEAGFARAGRAHLVTRSEGDEFIILLDGLNEVGEAKRVAERLLKEILAPFELNGREAFLSASIGIAMSASGYRNAEEALRDAGTALYRARSFGKARCEVFDTAILESTQASHQLEADFQGALSRNEFQVFYQPIVSLASNQIAGFEALVRWNHPARGMVLPSDFIPLAEKTGFIVPLGRWILHEACRQLKAWQETLHISKDLWISVNLSGVQFVQLALVKEITEALLNVDLDANNLILELMEGTVMENPEAARTIFMQLRVMGAKISLDDFGTGYSSLSHLRSFPLDYLKIDRSFVKSIETSHDTLEIIRTISSLAHQLGLRVIAEGIENFRQLELVRSLHCEYGQGFLFSRAVNNKQAEALLLDGISPREEAHEAIAATDKSDVETDASSHATSAVPDPDHNWYGSWIELKKRIFTLRGAVLIGAAALLLLVLGGLFARVNHLTPPQVAHSSPQVVNSSPQVLNSPPPRLSVEAEKSEPTTVLGNNAEITSASESQNSPAVDVGPEPPVVAPKSAKKKQSTSVSPESKKALIAEASPKMPIVVPKAANENQPVSIAPESQKSLAADVGSKPPAVVPETAKGKQSVSIYSYAVAHDHILGSCKGTLLVSPNTLSFVSEKEKDCFVLKYSECSYSLADDRLIIKTGSKIFRFKSATALTKDENRSQLQDIVQKISMHQQKPESKSGNDESNNNAIGSR